MPKTRGNRAQSPRSAAMQLGWMYLCFECSRILAVVADTWTLTRFHFQLIKFLTARCSETFDK